MNALWQGYLTGLAMIIFIGPVFFTLLQATLQYGRKAGMGVVMGIIISDVVAVLLVMYGARPFFENAENQLIIGIIGAALLFMFGLGFLIRKKDNFDKRIDFKSPSWWSFFFKGYAVNFVNPFVFMVWIGVVGNASKAHGYEEGLWFFLGASLLGIFTTDTAKVLFAERIKQLLNPDLFVKAYRIIGILLIGFGCWYLYRVL